MTERIVKCLSVTLLSKWNFPKAPPSQPDPTHTLSNLSVFLDSYLNFSLSLSLSSDLTRTSLIILDLALTVSESHSDGESVCPPSPWCPRCLLFGFMCGV